MSTNPRRRKRFKTKFAATIFFLAILGIVAFSLNSFINSGKPLFVSPIGKAGMDSVSVEKKLKEKNISYSQVVLSDDSFLIDITNNGQVRLSQNKDIDKQVSSLQRILSQLTIEGKSFRIIDFRFFEPIISF